MQRPSIYVNNITATGTYCQIYAINPTPGNLRPQGVILTNQASLATSTFYCFANAGTTGGVVVPVMMGPDDNFYPLASPTTLSAAGFGFVFQLTTPALAIGIQITTGITGGSVFLLTEALVL